MSGPTQSVNVPITAHLEIEDKSYTISAFDITFVAGQISTAEVSLAVGVRSSHDGKHGAGVLPHLIGVPAKIIWDVSEDVIADVQDAVAA